MRKYIFIFLICFLGLLIYGAVDMIRFSDNRLHITFCDVGQGDGIFIRTPHGSDIVIDGGLDEKILSCISSRMPFWDRTIDVIILTHPHFDHYAGLGSIISRYSVRQFLMEDVNSDTASYRELVYLLKEKKVTIKYVFRGDSIKTSDSVVLSILGPSKDYIKQTTPTKMIGETAEFASIISKLTYKDFSIVLTGDSQLSAFDEITLSNSTLLQIPHHGSATGLDKKTLQNIDPQAAIISVGKKNRYHHPSPFILNLLKEENIPTLRTDEKGSIDIITDGKKYEIANR